MRLCFPVVEEETKMQWKRGAGVAAAAAAAAVVVVVVGKEAGAGGECRVLFLGFFLFEGQQLFVVASAVPGYGAMRPFFQQAWQARSQV